MNTAKKDETKNCEKCKKRNCIRCALRHISANEFRLKAYTNIFDDRSMITGYMTDCSIESFTRKYYDRIVKLSRKSGQNYGWHVYSRDGMPCGFTNGEIMIPAKGTIRLSDSWRKAVFSFLKEKVRYDFSYLTEDELVNTDPDFLIPSSSELKKVYGKKTEVENELMFLCELVIWIKGYYIHLERCIIKAGEILDGKEDPVQIEKPCTSISKPLIDIVPWTVVRNVYSW